MRECTWIKRANGLSLLLMSLLFLCYRIRRVTAETNASIWRDNVEYSSEHFPARTRDAFSVIPRDRPNSRGTTVNRYIFTREKCSVSRGLVKQDDPSYKWPAKCRAYVRRSESKIAPPIGDVGDVHRRAGHGATRQLLEKVSRRSLTGYYDGLLGPAFRPGSLPWSRKTNPPGEQARVANSFVNQRALYLSRTPSVTHEMSSYPWLNVLHETGKQPTRETLRDSETVFIVRYWVK